MKNQQANLGYYNAMQRIIAKLAGFHGVKGEIKLLPLIDDLDVLEELEEILIGNNRYQISSQRSHKQWILVKLKGYDDLNSVEHLTGYVEANIEDDETGYYIADLIGLSVIDETNKAVGKVVNYSSEAQDHIFIKLDASFKAKSDLILPFVEEYILEVKLGEWLRVKLNEDLLELCL